MSRIIGFAQHGLNLHPKRQRLNRKSVGPSQEVIGLGHDPLVPDRVCALLHGFGVWGLSFGLRVMNFQAGIYKSVQNGL